MKVHSSKVHNRTFLTEAEFHIKNNKDDYNIRSKIKADTESTFDYEKQRKK